MSSSRKCSTAREDDSVSDRIDALGYALSGVRQVAPRRWRVYCSQWASCGWSGYRTGDTREIATSKPCPRCLRVQNRESKVVA